MEFKVFFNDQAKPVAVDLGEMNEASVMDAYESIDWEDHFKQLSYIKLDEIYHHPSFEVVHQKSKTSLLISAVGEAGVYAFDLTYVRPKKEKYFSDCLIRKLMVIRHPAKPGQKMMRSLAWRHI